MRDRLPSHDDLGLRTFPLIKLGNLWLVADRKMRGFDKGPRQISIAILGVALPFRLPLLSLVLPTQRQ